MKTVHGAEFYANKRHKGAPSHSSSDDGQGGISNASGGFDSSPRSAEDAHNVNKGAANGGSGKSASSLSIKSESVTNSPDHPMSSPINRLSIKQQSEGATIVMSGSNSTLIGGLIGSNVSAIDDPAWPYEDEDLEVADLPIVLQAMVGLSPSIECADGGFGRMGDGILTPAPVIDRNIRNRFRPRIQAKGMSSLSEIPEFSRRIAQNICMNRRPANAKMDPSMPCGNVSSQAITSSSAEIQNGLPNGSAVTTITSTANTNVHRDSISSNASSFYYSMKSADASRRSSQTSQYSTMMSPPSSAYGPYGMQPNVNQMNYNASSFYDPISPGSSRRSSEMSTVTTGGHSLPPPPSSHLLSCHLQRLQQSSYNKATTYNTTGSRFSVPTITPISNNSFAVNANQPPMDRRMSEPVQLSAMSNMLSPKLSPPSMLPKAATAIAPINVEQHPNREVDLDEVEEGEMVEDKLIIPEEFKNYLNQVADEGVASRAAEDAAAEKPPASEAVAEGHGDGMNAMRIPENMNMWRDSSANMYPISPVTQPHSPCSNVSQGMPAASPQAARGSQQNRTKPPAYSQPSMPFSQFYDVNDFNLPVQLPPDNGPYRALNGGHFADGGQRMASETNACTQMPGYYHRTDQSALKCCHLLREMQLDDKTAPKYPDDVAMQSADFKTDGGQKTATTTKMAKPSRIPATGASLRNAVIGRAIGEENAEIQCGVISQSQLSPAVRLRKSQAANALQQAATAPTIPMQTGPAVNPSQPQQQSPPVNYHPGMCQDAYQRTLEYVQSCQSWTENSEIVSSSTHPIANMTINDMTTSLNSLMEENRFLQMQQTIQ